MVRVTPIKLQAGTKVLWFDPAEHTVVAGDHVIVQTERGCEFGTATADIMEVSDELIAELKSPLKPVLRIADDDDVARAEELAAKGDEALATFKELAAETNDQMRPVMVEFLFDGDKAVFYFESEERIDFRDLVRKLASIFHVRVDMRQIGVRDGARMIGGIGHCGQELCCKRLGGGFMPVSIRMAKEQNLSLNPQKISGCCGRLMCCLRYEYETYKEVNARAPKHGAKIEVPDGVARVTEVNVPLECVTLQLEDGHAIKVPLDEMEITGEGKRPTRISQEVFDKYATPDPLALFEMGSISAPSFTGEDALADAKARPSRRDRNNNDQASSEDTHRKPRRRRRSNSSSQGASQQSRETENAASDKNAKKGGSSSRRQRRSSTRIDTKQDQSQARSEEKRSRSERRDRDDRKNRDDRRQRTDREERRSANQGADREERRNNNQRGGDRRPRNEQGSTQRSRRRPGQKSSGVRNAPSKTEKPAEDRQRTSAAGEPKADAAHRKPRRRRRKTEGEQTNAE